jgi:hypothetical protein
MSATTISWQDMLDAQRLDHLRGMTHAAVTVWKDGSYKIWSHTDAKYAEGDPDWLTTVYLPVLLADCPRDPPSPDMAEYDAHAAASWRAHLSRLPVRDAGEVGS